MRAPIVPAPSTATFLISRKTGPQDTRQWMTDTLRIMGDGPKPGQAQRAKIDSPAPISTAKDDLDNRMLV